MMAAPEVVAADEFILRRIHKNHVHPGPPPQVSYPAFRPTPDDTTGLSVYREKHVSAAEVVAAGRKPGEYYVARLAVRDLLQLGLSIVPDEQPAGPQGHALIPELSLDACRRDKTGTRAVQVRLAELASRQIVYLPDA
jgi:hypothetical protein